MRFKALFLSMAAAWPLRAAFDHGGWDEILKRHVGLDGLVDYAAMAETPSAAGLRRYLQSLESADPKSLSPREQTAFWVNAYNARMVQNVLDRRRLKKVSDDFGLFDVPFKAAGAAYSLNDIEHRILRGKMNPSNKMGPIAGVTLQAFDPRLHFALVCAALDCPRLRNFAYTGDNLEKTLQENAVFFANSPKHVSIREGRLRLSSLLKWYGEDFKSLGGAASYLAGLTDPAKRPDADAVDRLLLTRFEEAEFHYDWTVNDARLRR